MSSSNGWTMDDWEQLFDLRVKANDHQLREAVRVLELEIAARARQSIRRVYYEVQK